MKVLITSALSASAYQLKNKLIYDKVILGDYNELPQLMIKQGKMLRLPDPHSMSYAHQMLTLCLDNSIETVYILNSNEAEGLQGSRQLFSEYNINLQILPNEV